MWDHNVKTSNILGAINIILGALVITLPHCILPVCEYFGMYMETKMGMLVPMKCHYTAYAEVGVGATIIVASVVLMVSNMVQTKKALSIVGAVLGINVMLLPTYLTGMCGMASMPCRIGTQPALLILGVLIIIVNAIGFFKYRAKKES